MKVILMKTRIEYPLITRLSVATMLAISIAITQSLLISRGAAPALNVKTKPAAPYQPDDVDGVVQAAKVGITSLNTSNSAGVQAVSSALENFAAAVAGLNSQADLAAVVAEIKVIVERIEALREQIEALRNQMESIAQKFAELEAKAKTSGECTKVKRTVAEEYEKLMAQLRARIVQAEVKNQSTTSLKQELAALQSKRDDELRKLESSCSRVLRELEGLETHLKDTAKARKILDKLSVDRTKASQLVNLIRNNNRIGLSEFLQREAGGGDFVISDAKAVTGPLLIFRVDSISHCLSVGSQCGGKSYLFTR
jgi:predicted  nucleic acid-binding Zn-ribbon protein